MIEVETASDYHIRLFEISAIQMVLALFFSLILDGGVMFLAFVIALAAYWVSVLVMAVRTRFQLGRREKRYGTSE